MHKNNDRTQQKTFFNTEKILGKSLPSSIDAERSVLGAILLNDESLNQVNELLTAVDFYHPPHKIIYETVVELNKRLKRIDLVTLKDELEKSGHLEDIYW